MSDNLSIWNANSTTDPKACSDVQLGARTFTDIDPTYQFKRATELFGPMGIGWGLEGRVGYDNVGGPNSPGPWIATFMGKFWFVDEHGGKGEFPITACHQLTTKKDGAIKVNEHAGVSCLTSALKKSLAYLGFSADIYSGQGPAESLEPSEADPRQDHQHISKAIPQSVSGEPKCLDQKIKFGKYAGETWRNVVMNNEGYIQYLLGSAREKPDSDKFKKANIRQYTELLQWRAQQIPKREVGPGDNSELVALEASVHQHFGGDPSQGVSPDEIHGNEYDAPEFSDVETPF